MPPPSLYDFSKYDFDNPLYGLNDVLEVNPQRFEMLQLHGVVHVDREEHGAIGFLDLKEDDFWCRGHFPGYALMPGVLQCEAAAQLAGFYARKFKVLGGDFVGFGGMQNVRFRRPVRPPCRLVLCVKTTSLRPGRRASFDLQGFVDGKMVFNGEMIGVPIERGQTHAEKAAEERADKRRGRREAANLS
ncbi:3-hydroxyacyl-ACP dehydratase FabZ family protein [Alienimonas chondri]|uniref:3-hydroxyacyl-[acyl-carrier-protein] dehydratase n=1 Tax=Alienimonas chondri TaxID=2681879 RepID=A0ABX1V9S8_9PLAN|nr:3-hydroxyacyl-ACP dehydratase FabZ family protein [Alienimonas chondri]NNJ24201.1 hypothetical protein [Alienimonas chondri]